MSIYEHESRLVQVVRLVDVFLLGPVMVWVGFGLMSRCWLLAYFLVLSGIATVIFNGLTYIAVRNGMQTN